MSTTFSYPAIKVPVKSSIKRVKTALEKVGAIDTKRKLTFDENEHCLIPLRPESVVPDSIIAEFEQVLCFSEVQPRAKHDLKSIISRILMLDSDIAKNNEDENNPVIKLPLELRRRMVEQAPVKYNVYEPLLLLGHGAFTGSTAWTEAFEKLSGGELADWVFPRLADAVSSLTTSTSTSTASGNTESNSSTSFSHITHIAENAPIPDKSDILRLPSRLRPLYPSSGSEFDTLWCRTTQNGVCQVWHPMHTMFSRGNVTEKARILKIAKDYYKETNKESSINLDNDDTQTESSNRGSLNSSSGTSRSKTYVKSKTKNSKRLRTTAIDLYAGIGYFTFSYAKSGGFRSVLCWELNPWSIEGLKRGALLNGWEVVPVVPGPGVVNTAGESEVKGSIKSNVNEQSLRRSRQVIALKDDLNDSEDCAIVVFNEDNARCIDRLVQLCSSENKPENGQNIIKTPLISHINMGLLPHAHLAYPTAIQASLLSGLPEVYLHIHENVGVNDLDAWVNITLQKLTQILYENTIKSRENFSINSNILINNVVDDDENCGVKYNEKNLPIVKFKHLEKIKTYAPGVWHVCGDFSIIKPESEFYNSA